MGRKHSRRIFPNDPNSKGKQAKQLEEVMTSFAKELNLLSNQMAFILNILDRYYEEHQKARGLLRRNARALYIISQNFAGLKNDYRNYLADFEHKNGRIEAPSLMDFWNYTISLEDLLDVFPFESVMEDFLDG